MASNSPRILIVEDEQHIGRLVKFNCEAEGYQTTLVGDGPTALKLITEPAENGSSGQFDLVILDLMLPEMSGYAVLAAMREHHVQCPVLILSARTLSEDKIRGFELGADQYMTKPFELPELLARVKGLLARHAVVRGLPAPIMGDAYLFGDTRIDFARHEVVCRGEPRQLTALEMKLLRCFIEHEGRVLSRTELLDRVWGMDANPTTRTVDNFLMRLRQYFEVDPARPRHFLSVRGTGYKFVAQPVEEMEGSGQEGPANRE